jgi:hypothetical protein
MKTKLAKMIDKDDHGGDASHPDQRSNLGLHVVDP